MSDGSPLYDANKLDILRNRIEKLEQEKTILFNENEQLREACAKLQTNSGFKPASEIKPEDQDGEARLTDQKMLTDFIINALKRKPKEVIIKYRGSIILEIIPK